MNKGGAAGMGASEVREGKGGQGQGDSAGFVLEFFVQRKSLFYYEVLYCRERYQAFFFLSILSLVGRNYI